MMTIECPRPPDLIPWKRGRLGERLFETRVTPDDGTDPPSSRLMRLMFIPFCVAGIVESPGVVWNGKSSIFFKIYSGFLCTVAFVGSLRNFYLWYNSNADPLQRILDPKETFYCRLIYTIVGWEAFVCRLVCFIVFNFEQRRIADAHSRIAGEWLRVIDICYTIIETGAFHRFLGDPALKQSLVFRTAPLIWFHLIVGLFLSFTFVVNMRISTVLSKRLVEWDYIVIMITYVISISSLAYGQGLLSLMVLLNVCGVLKRGRRYFIDSVRSQRVEELLVS